MNAFVGERVCMQARAYVGTYLSLRLFLQLSGFK